MKKTTMKRTVSLFLATLMVVLAIPFVALPATAAEDAQVEEFFGTDDFESVKLYAQRKDSDSYSWVNFGNSQNAIDKKLDENKYYANSGTNALTKRAYIDSEGRVAFKEGGDYYGVIIVELKETVALESFTIWSPNGTGGDWLDNQAYDIYYSADGNKFVDSGIKIANSYEAHKLVPESNFPGEVTKNGTGVNGKIHCNEMDMSGITAKYIAIAVSNGRKNTTNSEQILLYEISAKGTVVKEKEFVGTDGFMSVNLYAQTTDTKDATKTVYTTFTGADAIDEKLDDGKYYATTSDTQLLKRACFDADGKIAFGDDGSYYGIIVAELNNTAKLDSFTIWSPNSLGGGWLDNKAYDIYYSVDGITFAKHTTIADSSAAHTPIDAGAFPGTVTNHDIGEGKNAGRVNHNEIDMSGVTAKYIAIAVSERRVGDGNKEQIVLWEISAKGTVVDNSGDPAYVKMSHKQTSTSSNNKGTATNALDGKLNDSSNYTYIGSGTKKYGFDGYGKLTGAGNSYFAVFIVELEALTKLNTFTIWSPNSVEGGWLDNKSYDIYYSVDGAVFSKAAAVTDAISAHKTVSVTDFPGTATSGDSNTNCIHRNDIAMNGVTAKYVAVAYNGQIPNSGNNGVYIFELTATGDIVEELVPNYVDIKGITAKAQNANGADLSATSDHEEVKAFDAVLNELNYYSIGNTAAKRAYFNDKGKVAFKDDGDYYAVLVVELDALTKLDTFTIWSPNSVGGGWLDNKSYDIYYSIGGEVFTALDGASFANAIDDAHVNVPAKTFPGHAISGNSTKGVYKNEIDMKGVTAKYVAIAVKAGIPDGNQILLYEVMATGTAVSNSLDSYTAKIESVELKAKGTDGASIKFGNNSYAIDGVLCDGDCNIADCKHNYATTGKKDVSLDKRAYFDKGGKIAYYDDSTDGAYYGIIVAELNYLTSLDSITLWSPNGKGVKSSYLDNVSYDIYYSVDGSTYVKSDVSVKNAYGSNYNSSLGEVQDKDWYELVENKTFPGTVKHDGTEQAGYINRNQMNMGGATAKYVAIAVSGLRRNSTTANEEGKFPEQIVIWEMTVEGSVAAVPDENIASIELRGYDEGGLESDDKKENGKHAFNGILNEDDGMFTGANEGLTPNTVFDSFGHIAYKNNGDYYGVFVVELNNTMKLDMFTLWSANTKGGAWFMNDSYDIYYSLDGTSFAPVDGASFTDVDSSDVYKSIDPSEFYGYAVPGEGLDVVYRHDINMNGIAAKYVAIAIKEPIPYEGRSQMLLYEVSVSGTVSTESSVIKLINGASVRLNEPTGLRFCGLLDKTYVDGLYNEYGKENVKLGILISPKDYVEKAGTFTKAALDDCQAISGVKYLEIDASENTIKTVDSNYKINCAIVNIKEANYERDFSAILYVKIIDGDNASYVYSDFNKVFNSRNVSDVAKAAYSDLSDEKDLVVGDKIYDESVDVVGGTIKYSPYTTEERELLEGFFAKNSTDITVMTYNIRMAEEEKIFETVIGYNWEGRDINAAMSTVLNSGVEVIGFQEDNKYLDEYLEKLESQYTRVNGVDNGKGAGNGDENNEIVFKTGEFELVDSGTVYYKNLKDNNTYKSYISGIPSKYELSDSVNDIFGRDNQGENGEGRFFRWVILEKDGVKFLIVNTHLHYRKNRDDDSSTAANKALREVQATLLRAWLVESEYGKSCSNQIVMGDMNSTPTAKEFKGFVSGEGNLDTAKVCAMIKGDTDGTLINNSENAPDKCFKERQEWVYDHILYNSDALVAVEYSVVDNKVDQNNTAYPSDHLPVITKFICN